MAQKHLLFSWNSDTVIQWFDKFNSEDIKTAIVKHLTDNPTDTLEHCKEFSKSELRRWAGYDIMNFYAMNKKNEPCKIITKGNKEYFHKLKN
jgi:hypothetical protein